jgi:hypothetical protein
MRASKVLLVSFLVLTLPSLASANEPDSSSAAPQESSEHPPTIAQHSSNWYGSETILVDLLSIGAMIGGGAASQSSDLAAEVFVPLGALGYALGGPIVHWSHGHIGKGMGSLGLRVSAPLAGLELGLLLAGPSTRGGDFSGLPQALLGGSGLLLGALGALMVDWFWLARENADAHAPQATGSVSPRSRSHFSVSPQLHLNQRFAGAGLQGQF